MSCLMVLPGFSRSSTWVLGVPLNWLLSIGVPSESFLGIMSSIRVAPRRLILHCIRFAIRQWGYTLGLRFNILFACTQIALRPLALAFKIPENHHELCIQEGLHRFSIISGHNVRCNNLPSLPRATKRRFKKISCKYGPIS